MCDITKKRIDNYACVLRFNCIFSYSQIRKFDIKCKSKKWVNETKDFQKKKLDESKNQLNKSKEVIKKTLNRK